MSSKQQQQHRQQRRHHYHSSNNNSGSGGFDLQKEPSRRYHRHHRHVSFADQQQHEEDDFLSNNSSSSSISDESGDDYGISSSSSAAAAAADELSQQLQPIKQEMCYLSNLVQNEYPKRIQALTKLLETLKEPSAAAYFDEEDILWVKDDLNKQQAELQSITETWNKTSSVYVDTYVRLSRTIETRQNVLNQIDRETGVFDCRPELVTKFANKQAHLASLMRMCHDKIKHEQREVEERLNIGGGGTAADANTTAVVTVNDEKMPPKRAAEGPKRAERRQQQKQQQQRRRRHQKEVGGTSSRK